MVMKMPRGGSLAGSQEQLPVFLANVLNYIKVGLFRTSPPLGMYFMAKSFAQAKHGPQ